jgi:phosphatidylglycerophosphatase A
VRSTSTPERRRGDVLALAVATAGGLGCLRPGPGTWASAATAAGAWLACRWLPSWQHPLTWTIAAGVALVAGLVACPAACRRFARKDPSEVVIDEVAGVLAGLAVVPAHAMAAAPGVACILVFVIFRVFDIAKPYPVSSLETLPGAIGIMADDIAAGVLAGMITAALLH